MLMTVKIKNVPVSFLPTFIKCIMPYGETVLFHRKEAGTSKSWSEQRALMVLHDGELIELEDAYTETIELWQKALTHWLPSINYNS